jgi:hypothetical protein
VTNTGEGFGKEISDHVRSQHILKAYLLVLHQFPREVILYVDVLGPVMEDWIFRQGNTTLVVHIHNHRVLHRNPQTPQEIPHPYSLLRRLAKRHILSFRGRKSDACLLLRFPTDHTFSNLHQIRSNQTLVVRVTPPIRVRVGSDLRQVASESEAPPPGSFEILLFVYINIAEHAI